VAVPNFAALEKLREILAGIGSMAVGFSAGVDSTFLLKVAFDVLGENAVAITTFSASLPACEKEEAIVLARHIGAKHHLVVSCEFENPRYLENTSRRCYFCKSELFRILRREADALGLGSIVYGAQRDDLGEFRPGMEAAGEFAARAPLLEAGLGKEEIRLLSRELGLPTWNKPAMACLASRIPHGTPVAEADLARVDMAERSVRVEGFRLFRVRARGGEARLEIARDEMDRLADASVRSRIARGILESGFTSVSIDPRGYRPGGGAAFPDLSDESG
jgi:pyridinium-3,5-biscarboxylic acid mononucleotide sulfurtransferase